MGALIVKLRPLGSRIVVEPIQAKTVTPGGIVLPDAVKKEGSQRGKIIAVGGGWTTQNGQKVPVDVVVGDEVIFAGYGGTEVEVGDKTYVILQESEILAVVS